MKTTLLSILFFAGISYTSETRIDNPKARVQEANAACLADTDTNRKILVNFLTKSEWSGERSQTGTQILKVNQIQVLTTSQYQCSVLKNKYSQEINETYPDGEKVYEVTLYKAGNFFFFVASLKDPSDPNEFVSGLSHLDVLDGGFKQLAGWSF